LFSATPSVASVKNMTLQASQTEAQRSKQSWQSFRFNDHGFQVSMPGQPVQYAIPDRSLPAQMYMQVQLTSSQQMEMYGVAVAKVPDNIPTQQNADRILSACSQQSKPGTQIPRPRAISLQSHPGMEVEARTPQGQLQLSRCYVVGQRLYMLVTMAEPISGPGRFQPTATPNSQRTPTMMQFLDSFQVMDLI